MLRTAPSEKTVPAVRLSTTSYLILGMIALRGPSTPYQLKRAVARSIGNFWPFPHSQFYAEPARLLKAGLLTQEREESGRRRLRYAITELGREAIREWLREPATEPMEIRDIGELKLFFGELGTAADLIALARTQEQVHRRRVADLEAIAARNSKRARDDPRMAPLWLGQRLYQVTVEFWSEMVAHPPQTPRMPGSSTPK